MLLFRKVAWKRFLGAYVHGLGFTWLDVANAYGSVPHRLIYFALCAFLRSSSLSKHNASLEKRVVVAGKFVIIHLKRYLLNNGGWVNSTAHYPEREIVSEMGEFHSIGRQIFLIAACLWPDWATVAHSSDIC